jgi:hypothetical protein
MVILERTSVASLAVEAPEFAPDTVLAIVLPATWMSPSDYVTLGVLLLQTCRRILEGADNGYLWLDV